MAETAARAALADVCTECASVQQAYAGYVYGDSTSGQAALFGWGQTGIPIVNLNNNYSTGSTAYGAIDCALALGFEQMQRGALGSMWADRPRPFTRFDEVTRAAQGWDDAGHPGRGTCT